MGSEKKHQITLSDRKTLSIDGVNEVISFDEHSVELSTHFGVLLISGEELNVSGLNLENGTVSISGRVNAMEYLPDKPLNSGSFISWLFSRS